MKRVLTMLLAMSLTCGLWAQTTVTPKQYYDNLMSSPRLKVAEAGEGWAWFAQWGMPHYVRGYRAWGDPEWIDYAVKFSDFLVSNLRTGPDGYKGWIGPHVMTGDAQHRQDTHMGDAILIRHMLEIGEVIRQNPELDAKYSAKVDEWIELAKVHLFEKWDARGTYHKVGELGAYEFWDTTMSEDLRTFIPPKDPEKAAAATQQFNKQTAMGLNALRLYRLTGDEQYRQRAFELFGFLKSRMQHYDGKYTWNFREVAIPRDILDVRGNRLRTWMEPHPVTASYQAAEVDEIVEAYHSGVVFDEQDMRRIVQNHLTVMWNGSMESPEFGPPNGEVRPGAKAKAMRWDALADFDQTIREMQKRPPGDGAHLRDHITHAYFTQVVHARPVSFERRMMREGESLMVLDFPHGDTRSLSAAFVINPHVKAGGERTILGVRTLRTGRVDVDLYDAGGEKQLGRLASQKVAGAIESGHGVLLTPWDGAVEGKALPPGEYRVRWTLSIERDGDEGYREYPVRILGADAAP